jgi:alginate O-acetyltransferase complex protein AlgI
VVFSSTTFLFLFLPVVLAVYFVLPRRFRNLALIAAGFVFYAWGAGDFVFVVLASTLADWLLGLGVQQARREGDSRRAALLLVLAVGQNLGLLFYYKYSDFLLSQLTDAFVRLGFGHEVTTHVLLPIGISFFTFEKISYLVDVWRGDVRARRNPLDVLLFVFLFPRSIAGPIVRLREIEDQLGARPVRLDDLMEGATRFVHGLVKKVVIADTVAPVADAAFANGVHPTTTGAWLGALAYTLQIYFDFSGYSDMAIGLAQVFGFRLPENFNRPYSAISITDFWRRWHMTLSRWFRDYLYIPLGGNRTSSGRVYFNLVLVFVLVGFWHGAQWTFILWGAYHGSLLIIERVTGQRPIGDGPVSVVALRRAITFLLVVFGWVLFRAPSLRDAGRFLWRMLTPHGFALGPGVETALTNQALLVGALGMLVVVFPRRLVIGRALAYGQGSLVNAGRAGIVAIGLPLALILVVSGTFSPFLYFRF